MVQSFHTQIEIALPPAEVKKLFLDFPSYPQWHKGLTVRPLDTSKAIPEPGDRLEINSNGMVLRPVVLENNDQHFCWEGNFHGLIKGTHMFRFLESREDGNKGGTTFVQAEDFEGWLSFIFVSWWPEWLGGMRGSIQGDFVGFNGGFKGWCEEGRNRG